MTALQYSEDFSDTISELVNLSCYLPAVLRDSTDCMSYPYFRINILNTREFLLFHSISLMKRLRYSIGQSLIFPAISHLACF